MIKANELRARGTVEKPRFSPTKTPPGSLPRRRRKANGSRSRSSDSSPSVTEYTIVLVLLIIIIACLVIYAYFLGAFQYVGDLVEAEKAVLAKQQQQLPHQLQQQHNVPAATGRGWLTKWVGGLSHPKQKSFPAGASFPPEFPIVTRGQGKLSNEALEMCTRTIWHTLETTTVVMPDADTFIHTGDIDDLWLRDSAAQIHPLLIPVFNGTALIQTDPKLDRIVSGLIKRTAMYIRHDPYANAFRIDDSYVFSKAQKDLGRHDLISTWNYELDSACYYIRLLYYYWNVAPNHDVLMLPQVQEAVSIMVDLWTAEQKHEDDVYPTGPLFDCQNCNRPYRYMGLPRGGKGSPTNSSSGLIWTGFRPSDDECRYNFLIPANMFAVVALEYTTTLATKLWNNPELAEKAKKLAAQVQRGIEEHGIVTHFTYGKIYAYEVDGLGNQLLMDDANIPSLMSIPYLGYTHYDHEIYENTRKFILSTDNPTYNSGMNPNTNSLVEGYGSPHMAKQIKNNIWPMSIAMQALTSKDVEEKARLVETLVSTTGGTGWMHESFDPNNPRRFTRAWFCWSDSLFAELVLSLTDACPDPSHLYTVHQWLDPVHVKGGPLSVDG